VVPKAVLTLVAEDLEDPAVEREQAVAYPDFVVGVRAPTLCADTVCARRNPEPVRSRQAYATLVWLQRLCSTGASDWPNIAGSSTETFARSSGSTRIGIVAPGCSRPTTSRPTGCRAFAL
jgi:hypothetical protein